MSPFRRKKLSQRIYRIAAHFGGVARQLRMQSKNMERQAERKFQRVKELMKKGFMDMAKQEATKVLTFRKRGRGYPPAEGFSFPFLLSRRKGPGERPSAPPPAGELFPGVRRAPKT